MDKLSVVNSAKRRKIAVHVTCPTVVVRVVKMRTIILKCAVKTKADLMK